MHRSDLAELKHKVDAVILFFDEYEVVYCVLGKRSAEILRSDDYELLIYCGVVYGACGYGEAITYFDAAERVAHTPTRAYAAAHRSAVFGAENLLTSNKGLECLSVTGGRYACSNNFRRCLDRVLMYDMRAS